MKTARFDLRERIETRMLLATLALLGLSVPGALAGRSQNDTPPMPMELTETYRLRVENAQYGRVEVSTDGGGQFLLIGRVLHPAEEIAPDRSASAPGVVLRSGGDGLAFSLGPNRIVKLRSEPPAPLQKSRHFVLPPPRPPYEPCAMMTNIASGAGFFGALAPPPGTPVRLQVTPQTIEALRADHILSQDDVFLFVVTLPLPTQAAGAASTEPVQQREAGRDEVRRQFDALAQTYSEGAEARARAEGRTVAAGTLTLKAKLPAGEPDPIAAVTYSVDGDLLAGQNVGPFSFDWNTRSVPDGEHVVEISALNRDGHLITRARALVVVENHPLPVHSR